MLNVNKMILHTGLMCVFVFITNSTFADSVDYNSVDISSLQNQYQNQLKPKRTKKISAKKTVKRKQIQGNELLQYQRLLANQQRAKVNTQKRIIKQPVRQAPRVVIQQRAVPKQRPAPQPVAAPAPRRDAIFEAATSGNVNLIRQLLSRGVNVNQANSERETALHMAAAKGHYSAVIYLINHGANIHARTINNWQPIHHATRFRHAQIANYLKQKGSQIYAKTSDGMSAVDMARTVNDQRILGVFGVR